MTNFRTLFYVFVLLAVNYSVLEAQTIHTAAETGDLALVKQLLEKNPELVNDNSGKEGRFPLHCAIRGSQPEIALYLIENGADANAKDENNSSVLFYASYYRMEEVVRQLVTRGADLKNDKSASGVTPFHYTARRASEEVLELMIEHGADVNALTRSGIPPLYYSISAGNYLNTKFLFENGANIDRNFRARGQGLMHIAGRNGGPDLLELLISKDIDPDSKDEYGQSALNYAIKRNNTKIVDFLTSNLSNINETDSTYGMSLLHWASVLGNTEVAEKLIKTGININSEDFDGNTPLDMAQKYGHQTTAGLLRAHGGSPSEEETQYGFSNFLKRELNPGEAIIWYLGHCGFAVKTQNKLLIFDYYEYSNKPENPLLMNGFINPDEINNLDVIVFISHAHHDHYNKIVFDWKNNLKNIKYIFGWKPADIDNYIFLTEMKDKITIDGLEIHKIDSILEPGGAFLVSIDELTIYHGGDFVGQTDDNSRISYLGELEKNVDFAFIGMYFDEVVHHTLQKINPKAVFPMHTYYQEYTLKNFAKETGKLFPAIHFECVNFKGDTYFYKNGKIIDAWKSWN